MVFTAFYNVQNILALSPLGDEQHDQAATKLPNLAIITKLNAGGVGEDDHG